MILLRTEEGIARKFAEKGIILSSGGLDRISEHELDINEILRVAKDRNLWLVTDEFLQEFVPDEKKVEGVGEGRVGSIDEKRVEGVGEKKVEGIDKEGAGGTGIDQGKSSTENEREKIHVERPGKSIFAKEIDSELKIFEERDITKRSTCEGRIEDFVGYFNRKYQNIREILRDRDVLRGSVPIRAVKQHPGDTTSIIVMVTEKRESSRGYRFLDVEDPTGDLSVLIPEGNNHQMDEMYSRIMLDEVIGIKGKMHNNLFIANEIFQPDIPLDNRTNSAEEEVSIALISDTHVGSYLFLEKEFNHFLDCLNLKCNNHEKFQNIKYILVAGDLVDGVGIYPKQENELSIPDIYKQYDFFASLIERVPDYIEVVLAMGNHDAVRGAEPQPKLDRDIGGRLYEIDNVHIVGNPATVSTHGVKTLIYHGASLDTTIGSLANCTYSRPEIAMIEYFKRRYLIPSYGRDNISPEKEDYLAIKDIPDIFHAGHVHTNGYADYRGVKIINSGTFQSKTKYQEEQGHEPTPARVPIINLMNHEVSVVHF